MGWRRGIAFMAIALAAGLGLLLPSDEPDSVGAGPDLRLIVLGDSISVGCCAPPENQWPAILAARLEAGVMNLAVGGATSNSLINQDREWPSGRTQSQLEEAVSLISESPEIAAVTLGIGTNDYLQNIGLRDPQSGELCADDPTPACETLWQEARETFSANVRVLLDKLGSAVEAGTPVLVMTIYLERGSGWMNALIEAEVEERGLVVADVAEYFRERGAPPMVSGDGVHKVAAGHRVIADVLSNSLPPDSDGDGLSDVMEAAFGSDPQAVDSDGDGCSDGTEFGPRALEGGRRDPARFWDFYDVWTRQGGAWERDRVVNVLDILGVARRFGPGMSGDHSPIAAALAPPSRARGYHVAFDRGAVIGPYDWHRAPADGSINVPDDILGVAAQFGHGCS